MRASSGMQQLMQRTRHFLEGVTQRGLLVGSRTTWIYPNVPPAGLSFISGFFLF